MFGRLTISEKMADVLQRQSLLTHIFSIAE